MDSLLAVLFSACELALASTNKMNDLQLVTFA